MSKNGNNDKPRRIPKHSQETIQKALAALVKEHPEAEHWRNCLPIASDLRSKAAKDLTDTALRNVDIGIAAIPTFMAIMSVLQALVMTLTSLSINYAIAMNRVDKDDYIDRCNELEDSLNKIILRATQGGCVVIKMKGED